MYPTMAGYLTVMRDMTIQPAPPSWKSEVFPDTGVMLRNGFPDPRETQLCLIAGTHRSHYDDDSGSFTLWGKGRIVSDMFGYGGATPAKFHNLVESPRRGRVMTVREFAVTDDLDYVDGLAGGWRRQIALIKDDDLLGPNYFVITDSFDQATSPTWRLWLSAEAVLLDGQAADDREGEPRGAQTRSALAVGKEDVDTDIFFVQSSVPSLRTQEETREAGAGLYPNGNTRRMPYTQICLIAQDQDCHAITAAIYPRMKVEASPEFSTIAEGHGVRIRHAQGVDYVFVSPTPIIFNHEGVAFEGTVGAVLLRKDRTVLSLGAAGAVAARGQRLESEIAVSQTWR